MAIPLLEAIDIEGKDITADALLTQRKFAEYLVEKRQAHYYFTVKGNQPGLLEDLQLYFREPGPTPLRRAYPSRSRPPRNPQNLDHHGTQHLSRLSACGPSLPHRATRDREKDGRIFSDTAYGLTSRTPQEARPPHVLQVNRGHWAIENGCHYILDWNYDEDRSRIRVGHGPENITRLRRFAIGVIKSRGARSVAQKMRQLTRHVRWVFDYLRMTENSCVGRRAN